MADRPTVQVIGRKVRLVHPPPAAPMVAATPSGAALAAPGGGAAGGAAAALGLVPLAPTTKVVLMQQRVVSEAAPSSAVSVGRTPRRVPPATIRPQQTQVQLIQPHQSYLQQNKNHHHQLQQLQQQQHHPLQHQLQLAQQQQQQQQQQNTVECRTNYTSANHISSSNNNNLSINVGLGAVTNSPPTNPVISTTASTSNSSSCTATTISNAVCISAGSAPTGAAILEIPSLGDELLNGSDTSSREVVINGRTYAMVESVGGQQMFVDVITQHKLIPIEHAGELTLVDVLDEDTDDAEMHREIEPEEFMDLGASSLTTHVDVIRPPSSAQFESVPASSAPTTLSCPLSPVLSHHQIVSASNSGESTLTSRSPSGTKIVGGSVVATAAATATGTTTTTIAATAATTPSTIADATTAGSGGGSFVRCDLCQATFSKRSNFYRHLRRAHETDSNLFRAKPQGVKGKCPECESRFFSRHELLLHLAHVHEFEVVLFNITFTNKEAYNRWLEDIKVHYTTSYVAHNGGRKSQDGRTGRIYHCSHEFMSYKMRQAESIDHTELTMRSRRSVANKVPYCTAHLRVFTDEKGVMYVSGSPTHINHDIDPDNLSGARLNLPSSETLPGYRSIFKNCQDGLPAQTKSTITTVVNRAEELKLYLQHRPVSDSVLVAIQRSLRGIQRAVSSYKCRAIVSDAILEDQSAQAAVKWEVNQ